MKLTRQDKIENFLSELDTEIDVVNYIDAEEVNCYSDVYQAIEDAGGFDIDIIYYSDAIKYLAENDASLHESLELAVEYGYKVSDLNSEVLASLHASANSRVEFYTLYNEINEFFDNLESEEDEEV